MAMTVTNRALPLLGASRFPKRVSECFLISPFARCLPRPFLAAFKDSGNLWKSAAADQGPRKNCVYDYGYGYGYGVWLWTMAMTILRSWSLIGAFRFSKRVSECL